MPSPKIAAKSLKKPRTASKKAPKYSQEALEQLRERKRDYMKGRYEEMTLAERAELRWRRLAKPPRPREGSVRGKIRRNVAIALAYCDWSDLEEVIRMYRAAAIMTELTGRMYTVDHVVPLLHELVCGLHTHTNMEVISLPENEIKGNRFWPGMWGEGSDKAMEMIEQLGQLLQQQQEDRLKAANDDEHSRSAPRKRRRPRRCQA